MLFLFRTQSACVFGFHWRLCLLFICLEPRLRIVGVHKWKIISHEKTFDFSIVHWNWWYQLSEKLSNRCRSGSRFDSNELYFGLYSLCDGVFVSAYVITINENITAIDVRESCKCFDVNRTEIDKLYSRRFRKHSLSLSLSLSLFVFCFFTLPSMISIYEL